MSRAVAKLRNQLVQLAKNLQSMLRRKSKEAKTSLSSSLELMLSKKEASQSSLATAMASSPHQM